ncbi:MULTISPECIES: phage tail tape measure protein [unclassified Granulicatella]|uniref:phage tail tape measure protein n=1 Tax=unclassified Granulicatella TaxID=2630493 RepID=UPI001073D3F4|nr:MULTISPECIES: phage tail tape measure protein [unclassified Granulicatella]MBF0780516.1 phage tail tape measure protein [Granulicatella sp. 19428wC4_WM01]TFU95330.1 phage tail tape measure protein [Granulicatella sp. WM01]
MEEVLGNLKIRVGMDTTEFVGKMKTFKQQMAILKSNMKEAKDSTTKWGKAGTGLAKQIDNTKKRLTLYDSELQKHDKILQKARQTLSSSKESYDKLKQAKDANLNLTSEEIKKLDELTKGRKNATKAEQVAMQNIARLQAEMAGVNRELGELQLKYALQTDKTLKVSERLSKVGDKTQKFGNSMYKAGKTLTAVTATIGGGILGVVKIAANYESAFAGVRKTVSATEPEFKKMSDGFRKLSKEIPVSAAELAKVGENAGQLGIQVPNILQFTEIMAKLGMATNLTADQASTSLAKFANITQMSQKDFDRLGSTIVALGNNYATTEADIVSMATQLAGAGHSVGLSEAQILAVSAALSSVGIEAERGGSTFSKLMINMKVATETGYQKALDLVDKTGLSMRELELMASNNSKKFKKLAESLGMTTTELQKIITASNNLESFAEVAGMSSEAFRDMFNKDTVGAIGKFVEGLSTAGERGTTAVQILDEMGVSEIRLRDTLLRLGGAQNLMNEAVKTGTQAWNENTALNKEVTERNKTAASKFEMFKNKLIDVAIAAGEKLLPELNKLIDNSDWLVKAVSDIVMWFANLDEGTKKLIFQLGLIGPLLMGVGKPLSGFGGLLKGVFSIVKNFRTNSITEGIGAITTSASGAVSALGNMSGATTGLGTVMKMGTALMNPWVLGIVGVTAAVAGGVWVYNELTKSARESAEVIEKWGVDVGKATSDALTKVEDFGVKSQDALNHAVKIDEKNSKDISNAYTDMFQEMGKIIDDQIGKIEDTYSKLSKKTKKYAEKEKNNRIEKYNEAKNDIGKIEGEINAIVDKAAQERRRLREDELTTIKRLQQEAKEITVATLGKSAAEQNKILQNMSDSVKQLDKEQLHNRREYLRELASEHRKAYEEEKNALQQSLTEGMITHKQYYEGLEELDKESYETRRRLAISTYETMNELISRQTNSKVIKSLKQELSDQLEKLGFEYQQMAGVIEENAKSIERSNDLLTNSSGIMADKLSDNVKRANEHWNNLITDEATGRVVDNLREVVEESVKTQEGWDALRFDIKHADLKTNAKGMIEIALKQVGKWDELTIEEKSFLTSTNAGVVLQKLLETRGEWESFSPEIKKMILESNFTDEQMKFMDIYGIWGNAEFREQLARIDTNSVEAKDQFTDLITKWSTNHFDKKVAEVKVNPNDSADIIDKIRGRINSLQDKTVNIRTVYANEYYEKYNRRQYATGTNFHEGGLAILGDGGRREPFLTPQGYFGVSPDNDTMYDLPKGTKVWSSVNKFLNVAKYNPYLKQFVENIPKFKIGTDTSFLDYLPNKPISNHERSSDVYNINIYGEGMIVREDTDLNTLADKIIEKIEFKKRRKSRNRGEVV